MSFGSILAEDMRTRDSCIVDEYAEEIQAVLGKLGISCVDWHELSALPRSLGSLAGLCEAVLEEEHRARSDLVDAAAAAQELERLDDAVRRAVQALEDTKDAVAGARDLCAARTQEFATELRRERAGHDQRSLDYLAVQRAAEKAVGELKREELELGRLNRMRHQQKG